MKTRYKTLQHYTRKKVWGDKTFREDRKCYAILQHYKKLMLKAMKNYNSTRNRCSVQVKIATPWEISKFEGDNIEATTWKNDKGKITTAWKISVQGNTTLQWHDK